MVGEGEARWRGIGMEPVALGHLHKVGREET